ncbi:MAG: hypothetical protein WCQ82_00045 [Bacteroidaceae bacterium]|nr:hypothetical protein [Bacteroidaceae bacterium]
MPYRRLPKTDAARLKALSTAIRKFNSSKDLVFSYKLFAEIDLLFPRFQQVHTYYKQCYHNQVVSSRKHQNNLKTARLYISHFIQVLNLSVIRGEISAAKKALYKLPENSTNVPDLTSEKALLMWGENIIEGEQKRCADGRLIRLSNPSIAKVRVYYDLFKDSYEKQQNLQDLTAANLQNVAAMRQEVDDLLLAVWNEVEHFYADLPTEERVNKCRAYGVVYYYRKGEQD